MKPAMTREEWDAGCAENGYDTFASRDDDGRIDTYDAVFLKPEDCHKVAALCLHNQPFGFHREDVANIRDALIFKYREPDDERNEQLESLADRIEALLPPEDK